MLVHFRDKLRKASENVAYPQLAFELKTFDMKDQSVSRTFNGLPQNRGGAPNDAVNCLLHKELAEALYRVSDAAERLANDRLDQLREDTP